MRFLLLLLVFGAVSAQGQGQRIIPLRGPSLSAGMQMAIPRGEFADQFDGMPYGVNAALSMPVLNLPLEAGGGFAWNRIGAKSDQVSTIDELGRSRQGELQLNGNSYTYYVHGRLRPFNGRFRPYGEVLAGMRTYSVRSVLEIDDQANYVVEPIKEVSDRDFVWVTGWAVGVQYRLLSSLFVEARFEKLRGDRAQYIDPASIEIQSDGSFDFEMQESRTDQFNISLGLAFSF